MTKDKALSVKKVAGDLLQWIPKSKSKLQVKAEELLIARALHMNGPPTKPAKPDARADKIPEEAVTAIHEAGRLHRPTFKKNQDFLRS